MNLLPNKLQESITKEILWLFKWKWKIVHIEPVFEGDLGTVPASGSSAFIEYWQNEETGEHRERRV